MYKDNDVKIDKDHELMSIQEGTHRIFYVCEECGHNFNTSLREFFTSPRCPKCGSRHFKRVTW